MVNIFFDIIFLLTTIYISLKAIGYGVYEFKENNNKVGGISVAVLAIASSILANIAIRQY